MSYVLRFIVVAGICATALISRGAETTDNVQGATLDYGVVPQGQVLKPCVRILNLSNHVVRVQNVRPTGGNIPPFDITMGPGEEVIKPLAPLDTRGFVGPIAKNILLTLTPPSEVEVGIVAACSEPSE